MSALMKRPTLKIYASSTRLNTEICSVKLSSTQASKEVEYPPVRGKYPPGTWPKNMNDMHPSVCWRWHDAAQKALAIPTIKERLKRIQSRTVKCYSYRPFHRVPNALKLHQFVTKTAFQEGLPQVYKDLDVEEEVKLLKPLVLQAIASEKDQLHRSGKDVGFTKYLKTHALLKQILIIVMTALGSQYRHLVDSHLNEFVKICGHWDRYGVERPLPVQNDREYFHQKIEITPVMTQYNKKFFSEDTMDFQLRTQQPLPEFVSLEDTLCSKAEYPVEMEFPVRSYGFTDRLKSLKVIPGFMLGDPYEFGHLGILNTNNWDMRKFEEKYGEDHTRESRKGLGMNQLFLWSLSQAYYQGFSTYVNTTYPFTSQGIVTDGRTFLFMAYQLNTLFLWKDNKSEPKRNLCWHTNEQNLYETVEDGEVKGFSDEVFENLVKFLLIKPVDRGYNLKPSLPPNSPDLESKHHDWIPHKESFEEIVEEIKFDAS